MTDQEAIRGLWRVTSYVSCGNKDVARGFTHYQFEGNRYKEIDPSMVDNDFWVTIDLDPTKRPKQYTETLVWTNRKGTTRGKFQHATIAG